MREDIAKVVIERPRYGYDLPSPKTALRIRRYDPDNEYEDSPQRIGNGLKHLKGTSKGFTDYLKPLEGLLKKNVGRPWDKVYSELCAHLDRRKTTGRHVFEHLASFVATNCFYDDDGELWFDDRYGRVAPVSGARWFGVDFYVDPKTRLLCQFDPNDKALCRRKHEARKAQARRTIERKPLSFNQSYVRINGLWYIGDYVEDNRIKAPVDGQKREEGVLYFDGKRWMRLASKRKCNQQELQKAGLNNANPA